MILKKLKVAIVIPGLCFGGAETMVTQLVKHIDKSKFDVYLIAKRTLFQNEAKALLEKIENINIISLDENKGINLRAIFKMSQILKKIRPNVIHTHLHIYAYLFPYVLFHKVKVLHTVHNMPIYESKKSGKLILKILFKLKKAIPVGISDIITKQLKDFYKIKTAETIYNFVDLKRFNFNNKKDHETFTFITVGRMEEQKNQILLLKAFNDFLKLHNSVKLIFAGDGDLRDELVNYACKNNIESHIEFIGNVINIEDFYAKADVFVLSSIYEGLPMTILEAMACGLPIISTNVGGVADIVRENGILVNSNSQEELLNAMITLYRDNEKRNLFSTKSVKNSRKYDIDTITKQYEALYLKYSNKRNLS